MPLFARKQMHSEETEKIVQTPPKPLPVIPKVSVAPLGAYEKLAAEIGFHPAQLLEEQIKRFLIEQKISVYNYQAVDKYLTHV